MCSPIQPFFPHAPLWLDEVVFPPLAQSRPRLLTDLEPRQCRWPVGPAEPGQRFCAEPAAGAYCPQHGRQGRRSRSRAPAATKSTRRPR